MGAPGVMVGARGPGAVAMPARMRDPGAGWALRGGRGAAPPVSTRKSGAARASSAAITLSRVRSALRKVLPWLSLGPPCAASSARVSVPARRLCFAGFFSPIATNPLTHSLLLQMPGSTRRDYTPKVSGCRAVAEIRLGGASPTARARRPCALRRCASTVTHSPL